MDLVGGRIQDPGRPAGIAYCGFITPFVRAPMIKNKKKRVIGHKESSFFIRRPVVFRPIMALTLPNFGNGSKPTQNNLKSRNRR